MAMHIPTKLGDWSGGTSNGEREAEPLVVHLRIIHSAAWLCHHHRRRRGRPLDEIVIRPRSLSTPYCRSPSPPTIYRLWPATEWRTSGGELNIRENGGAGKKKVMSLSLLGSEGRWTAARPPRGGIAKKPARPSSAASKKPARTRQPSSYNASAVQYDFSSSSRPPPPRRANDRCRCGGALMNLKNIPERLFSLSVSLSIPSLPRLLSFVHACALGICEELGRSPGWQRCDTLVAPFLRSW